MTKRWLLFVGALLLLNASLSFRNVWPTPLVTWKGELSIELAVFLLTLAAAMTRWRVERRASSVLAVVWLFLVIGHYSDVTAPALWGRDLNFYWDLRFLPDVVAMLASAARPWLVVAAAIVVFVVLAALFLVIQWSIREVVRGLARPSARWVSATFALATIALFVSQQRGWIPSATPAFSVPAATGYSLQLRNIVRGMSRARTLPASPSFEGNLPLVHGADVLLFFIESYGAIAFDRSEFSTHLEPRRAAMASAIRVAGKEVVSAFVESPTFGGSSWFAHVTLLSGIDVRDPDTNALLLGARRQSLPSTFRRNGYRTLAVLPGMWAPWREGEFYGFSESYNAPGLGYQGPPFGWWDLTDQFTYAALDALELSRRDRPPLFVFLPTVSTHTPFTPTPPYQPDWSRMTTNAPYDMAALDRAYADDVDWTNLGPGYLKALDYSYETLTGYIRQHAGDDLVLILIGDHQPPALVTGEGASWEVPVHIVTSRRQILDRLTAKGFRQGLTPQRPGLGPMHTLTPVLLDAFGR